MKGLVQIYILLATGAAYSQVHLGDTVTHERQQIIWHRLSIPVQFAGNIGFISTGVRLSSKNGNYHLSILYGYVPEVVSTVSVHTITTKNTFDVCRIRLKYARPVVLYAGLAISLEVGGRSFFIQPSMMPDKYYRFPKSVHAIVFAGARTQTVTFRGKFFRGMDFFIEAVTVDAYMWYKTISTDVKLSDIVTASFGIHLKVR